MPPGSMVARDSGRRSGDQHLRREQTGEGARFIPAPGRQVQPNSPAPGIFVRTRGSDEGVCLSGGTSMNRCFWSPCCACWTPGPGK
jgi:hypothetical protein